MDNKLMLIKLVEKYMDILDSNKEYIICNKILTKLKTSMLISNSEQVELNFSELCSFTPEEKAMFTDKDSDRIIASFKALSTKKGWSIGAVVKLIKRLEQDIIINKMPEFNRQKDSLNELMKIIDYGLYKEKYNLILDLIKLSVENKMLSYIDAINLNFFVLNQCSDYHNNIVLDDKVETTQLVENKKSIDDTRNELCTIFSKYGYVYDTKKMGDLDYNFVRYADLDYVDYILSKFMQYGIDLNEIYVRKRAIYNIVIDNDKETFDSILHFIDNNECSLSMLFTMPAVFAKRKKNYVESESSTDTDEFNSIMVFGANQDFFSNIELYKKLSGVDIIRDEDLSKLGKFLCTPNDLVNKNLLLLEKYKIIKSGILPKAIVSLCGNNTEYIIDRMIEVGLYESYLCARTTKNGEIKQARGTYFLGGDNNPFRFYKMKRANDLGNEILAQNGGIRKVFRDNNEGYVGISLYVGGDGNTSIIQKQLSDETINNIPVELKKSLPDTLQRKIDDGRVPQNLVNSLYFNNLYKYKTVTPIDIFSSSDNETITNLKGDRITILFKNDYKKNVTEDEMKAVLVDNFINILDNAIYSDSLGNFKPLKVSDLEYHFSHPSFPNINVVISRFKVLRLCKLLKDNDCWINQDSNKIDKENTILSVVIKDTVVSDTEMIVLRMTIRQFLINGIIKVPEVVESKSKRGARK